MDTTSSMILFKLDFGVRNSIRSADNDGYTLVTPVCTAAWVASEKPNAVWCAMSAPNVDLERQCDPHETSTWCYRGQRAGGPFAPARIVAADVENSGAPLGQLPGYTNLLGSAHLLVGGKPKTR